METEEEAAGEEAGSGPTGIAARFTRWEMLAFRQRVLLVCG